MQNSYVIKNIKRCNRNFLLVNIIISLIILLIFKGLITDIYNISFGPFEVDKKVFTSSNIPTTKNKGLWSQKLYYNGKEELNRINIDNKYYFKLINKNVFHTGVEETYTNDISYKINVNPLKPLKGKISEYLMTSVDDKYLIIRVKKYNSSIDYYKGCVVSANYIPGILENSDLDIDKNNVLPFIFDTTKGVESAAIIWIVIATIFLIFNIYLYFRILSIKLDYKKHPIYKHLSFYGKSDEIMTKIDSEVPIGMINQKVINTESWILWKKPFSIGICQSSKLNDK